MLLIAGTIGFIENTHSDMVRIGIYRSEFNYKLNMKSAKIYLGIYTLTPGWISTAFGYPLYNIGLRGIYPLEGSRLSLGATFFYFNFAGEENLKNYLNEMIKKSQGESAPELTELKLNIKGFKSSIFGSYRIRPNIPLFFELAAMMMPQAEQDSFSLGAGASYELFKGSFVPSLECNLFYTKVSVISQIDVKLSLVMEIRLKHFGLKLGGALPGETVSVLEESLDIPVIPFVDIYLWF